MTQSAADERDLESRSEVTRDGLIRVGMVLTPDRELVAGAITMLIERTPSFELVTVRADGDDRLIHGQAGVADVVIVDRVAVVAPLRSATPGLRVIVLLAESDPDEMLSSIRAGASACIDDSTPLDTLVDIVERVWAGEAVFEPNILVELLQRQSIPTIAPPNRTARLSERELEVLAALARGASPVEAADEFGISVYTIRTHLKNILVKMGARSKLEAVVVALREGRISLNLPDAGDETGR